MAVSIGTYDNDVWLIKSGQMSKLTAEMRSMSKLDMSWEQLKSNIKSCYLCEGLNSEELETLNAPEHKQLIREIYDSPQPLIKLENKR